MNFDLEHDVLNTATELFAVAIKPPADRPPMPGRRSPSSAKPVMTYDARHWLATGELVPAGEVIETEITSVSLRPVHRRRPRWRPRGLSLRWGSITPRK